MTDGQHPSRLDHVKQAAIRFVLMFVYLLIVFALFQLHEFIVLREHGLPYTRFGVAIVNALVIAKVMLIADEFHLGEMRGERPLALPILIRSAVFAATFIAVDLTEKLIKNLLEGHALEASLSKLGAGLTTTLVSGVDMAVMLIPFFAFVEIGRILGMANLRRILFIARDARIEIEDTSPARAPT
jgi:hypothetical protein